jgi:hypothetical protein
MEQLVESVRFCVESSWRPEPVGAAMGDDDDAAAAAVEQEGAALEGEEEDGEGSGGSALDGADEDGEAGEVEGGKAGRRPRRTRASQSEWMKLRAALLRQAAADAKAGTL